MPKLKFAGGRTGEVTLRKRLLGDREYDFDYQGKFIGGNRTDYNEALADAVSEVEEKEGVKVIEVDGEPRPKERS